MTLLVILWVPILLLNTASVEGSALKKAELSSQEEDKLTEIVLNHEFYSGCVTEKISDIQMAFCDDNKEVCDGGLDQEEVSQSLDYEQWRTIYKACIADKLG